MSPLSRHAPKVEVQKFRGDSGALQGALELLAEHETLFNEAFYEIFFARRPDTLPLFGAHDIAEREEMIHETLRSLYAISEEEEWLPDNLIALGQSHAEYGVTTDMYDSFCDALVDCSRQILGDSLGEVEVAALRLGIAEVSRQMSEAGAPRAGATPLPDRRAPTPSD